MRKLCTIAMVLLCLAVPLAVQAQNPIANPGFDTGEAISIGAPGSNPWYINQSDYDNLRNAVAWSVVSARYHSAGYSALASAGTAALGGGSGGTYVSLRQKDIVLQPSTTYKLGFWYWSAGPGWQGSIGNGKCDVQIFIVEYTSGGAASWPNVYTITTASGGWAYYEQEFTTQSTTATIMLKFQCALATANIDKFYVDDVSFTYVPPVVVPDGPLVTDSFTRTAGTTDSLGTTDAPNAYPWTRGIYNGVIDPRVSVDGSKLVLGTGPNCWSGVFIDQLLTRDFDAKFTISSTWVGDADWSGIQYRGTKPMYCEYQTGNDTAGDPAAYMLRFYSRTGSTNKYRVQIDSYETGSIGGVDTNIDFNTPHVVRLRVVGTTHKVWIDNVLDTDTPILNVASSNNTGAGYFEVCRRDSPTTLDDLHLQLHDAYGTVAGVVRNASTNNPVEGADITILGKTVTTGADGSYSLPSLITGDWQMDVVADGYAAFTKTTTVTADTTTTEDVYLTPSPAIDIYDTFTRDDSADLGVTEDARHCPWIKPDVNSPASISSGTMLLPEGSTDGVALGGGVFAGDFDMVSHFGCGSYSALGYSGFAYRCSQKGIEDLTGYAVRIDPDANTLTLLGHGDQLATAEMPYSVDFYSITSPAVEIGVIGNRHRVWVDGVKYIDFTDTSSSARTTGGFFNIYHHGMWAIVDDIYLTAWGSALAGSITGTVSAGGSPVDGADVVVAGFGSAITGSDGKYTISDIVPGQVSVWASKPGLDSILTTATIPSGAAAAQNFDLPALPAGVYADTFTRDDNADLGATEDASHTAWVKSNDVLSITSHQLKGPSGGATYVSAALQGVQIKNFEASFDVTLISSSNVFGGIMYRVPVQSTDTNANQGYLVEFNPSNIFLWSSLTGHIAGPQNVFTPGVPHRLKIRVEDDHHQCWVDDTQVFDVTNAANTNAGYICLMRCIGDVTWDNFKLQSLDVPAGTPVANTRAAKALGVGQAVILQEAIITGKSDSLGFFYVEDANRTGGIKIVGATTEAVGTKVQVTGTTGVENGEMFITAASGGVTALTGGVELAPIVVNGRELDPGRVLSTIGMLVKVAGKVTAVDTINKIITIDDGSGTTYYASYGDGFTVPSVNDIVICRGCAGCNSSGSVIWMFSPSDLRKVGP